MDERTASIDRRGQRLPVDLRLERGEPLPERGVGERHDGDAGGVDAKRPIRMLFKSLDRDGAHSLAATGEDDRVGGGTQMTVAFDDRVRQFLEAAIPRIDRLVVVKRAR